MANNVAVKITADVTDLVAKRAILQAESRAVTKELNDLAKASRAGLSDQLKTDLLKTADAAVTAKTKISALDQQIKAAQLTQQKSISMTGQQRIGLQQLGWQFGDVSQQVALGVDPMRIFVQQGGQVIQAVQFMTEGTGKLATFLSGPWGLAIAVGLQALVPLVAKMFEGGEAFDKSIRKLKEDAEATDRDREAKAAFNRTLEGQIVLQRELNAELDRGVRSQRDDQQLTLAKARKNLNDLRNSAQDMADKVEKQQKRLDWLKAAGPNITAGSTLDAAQQQAAYDAQIKAEEDKLKALQRKQAAAERAVRNASRAVREAEIPMIKDDVAAQTDKKAAAVQRYTDALSKLDRQLAIGAGNKGRRYLESKPDGSTVQAGPIIDGIDKETYARRLRRITAQRDKALKEQDDASRSSRGSDRQYGREIDSSQARSIAQAAGFTVTSADRSFDKQKHLYDAWVAAGKPKDNPVAPPGSSAHNRGNALDIGFGSGVSPKSLREAFDKEGVRLTKILKERGHYHIEWSTAGADKAQRDADRAKKRADDEAARAAKQKASDDRQISTGAADTTLQLSRIDLDDRKRSIQDAYSNELISAEEKRDALKRLAEQEAAAEKQALEAKKAAYAGDTVAVKGIANQQLVVAANLSSQLKQIDRDYYNDKARLREQDDRKRKQVEARQLAEARRTTDQIMSYESQLVRGIISGRQSAAQILINIGDDLVARFIEQKLREFTFDRVVKARGLAIHAATESTKVGVTLTAQTAQTAAHATALAAQTTITGTGIGVHAAGEAIKTAATVAGESARVATTIAGTAIKAKVVGASNAKEIISHAATAAAGAYHAMAAVPIIGPALGAAAAVATFAAVSAFGALASFDLGADMLSRDQIAQVHAGERIVPRDTNRKLEQFLRQPDGGLGGAASGPGRGFGDFTYAPAFHGVPERDVIDELKRQPRELAVLIQTLMRDARFN